MAVPSKRAASAAVTPDKATKGRRTDGGDFEAAPEASNARECEKAGDAKPAKREDEPSLVDDVNQEVRDQPSSNSSREDNEEPVSNRDVESNEQVPANNENVAIRIAGNEENSDGGASPVENEDEENVGAEESEGSEGGEAAGEEEPDVPQAGLDDEQVEAQAQRDFRREEAARQQERELRAAAWAQIQRARAEEEEEDNVDLGNSRVNFGKYRHETIRDVHRYYPGYIRWCRNLENPHPCIERLLAYQPEEENDGDFGGWPFYYPY